MSVILWGTLAPGPAAAQGTGRPAPPARNPAIPRRALESLYRPTVTILKGRSRGTGTVVASYPGETLVLTAAHVIDQDGDLSVEFQPYNFGVESDPVHAAGPWPRRVAAEVAAQDAASDVAVVRVRGRFALPYVARVALQAEAPKRGTILTSVGVDQNDPLTGWTTDVQGNAEVDIGRGGPRPFTITTKAPEHGRSGGGLFLPDGSIVGVCVARLEARGDRPARGMFASIESIRTLLRENDLERRLAHSEAWRKIAPRRNRVLPPAPQAARR